MKSYLVITYFILLVGGFTYIVKTEKKISNLQNELLISKANEEQQKIEIKNNQAIIVSLDKKLKHQQAIEKQKQEKIKEMAKKISTMSIKEKINTINNVFNNF